MQGFVSIAVSVGFLFTTSFVLMSCMSCRKFLAKRKLKKERKKEKINIPDIKIDVSELQQEEKQGNGIANPSYQEAQETKEPEQMNDVEEKKESDVEEQKQTNEKKDEEPNTESTTFQATEVTEIGAENKAYEVLNEVEEEIPPTVSNFEKEVLEHVNSQYASSESESTKNEIVNEISAPEQVPQKQIETILFDEKLSEEELDAYNDVVFQGEWRRPVVLKHLLEIGLIDKKTADEIKNEAKQKSSGETANDDDEIPEKLKKYLCGDEPVAGILVADTGEKKSIFKSAKEGILRRGTAISLLEAQAATGNIIDPVTGRKMSVKEATQLGLLDKVYETVLLRAERAVIGYKFRASDHVLSLYEAMQKGLVVESHGLRLLEAQCATGGVMDHRINIRLPLDVAVKRGLLDERLKEKLEDDDGDDTKTFFDPNTEENVTYKELMKRSIVDTDTGLRLYPLEKIVKKRISYGSYSGRSSRSSSRTVSRSNSQENLAAMTANS